MGEQGAERAPDKVHEEASRSSRPAHVCRACKWQRRPRWRRSLRRRPWHRLPPRPRCRRGRPRDRDVPERISAPRPPARPPALQSEPPRGPGAPPARLVPAPPRACPPGLAAGGFTVLANPTRSREEADGLAKTAPRPRLRRHAGSVVRDGDTLVPRAGRPLHHLPSRPRRRCTVREHEGVEHASWPGMKARGAHRAGGARTLPRRRHWPARGDRRTLAARGT